MQASTKVILNTGILYAQLVIGMAIGFFTTRIVLDALGEINYGIYMLVAGVVGMLGILNSNMSNTSMRYMAHSLGKGDMEETRKTFNTTLFLHFIIGIIVIFLMEIGGWLMFKYVLNIPIDKLYDAKVVFHFMVITTFVTVISVPYDAVMNSHENILALSLVDIFGYVLRLAVAIYLSYSTTNLLILYGFLMLIIQLLLRIIKQWYSRINYNECKIKLNGYIDKKLMKAIISFTGWNLLNSVSALAIVQIKGVFLNVFFGVQLNTADGIANQAGSQVNMISVNMSRALNPQIMKSEGGGNRNRMLFLTELGTKYSAFLFSLFAIPLYFEAPFLLKLWLKSVPDYAVVFFQIILIAAGIEKFTFEITTAIRAVGNIKNLQIVETSILLLNIPIYYIVLQMGYSPQTIYITSILVSLVGACVRLYFGKQIADLNIIAYFKNAVIPVVYSILITIIAAYITQLLMQESINRMFIILFQSIIIMSITFWFWGLNKNEKNKLVGILNILKNKLSWN